MKNCYAPRLRQITCLGLGMFLFFLLFHPPAAAQQPGAGTPDVVPIEKEPMHRLKFENEYVRLFEVLVPVGKATLFHVHLYDGISVRVSDAQIIDEILRGANTPFDMKYGAATFGPRPAPMTHRVVNSGKSDFRNIFIELLQGKPAMEPGAFPILSDGHVILLENDRVRINRLTLKPGESSKLHMHRMSGLGIILHDSKIEISSPGAATRTLETKAGDHAWQNAGTAHLIKNIGSTVFEAIDIELKEVTEAPGRRP